MANRKGFYGTGTVQRRGFPVTNVVGRSKGCGEMLAENWLDDAESSLGLHKRAHFSSTPTNSITYPPPPSKQRRWLIITLSILPTPITGCGTTVPSPMAGISC